MPNSFNELKHLSKSGESLKTVRGLLRYDLGTHKKTRLKLAGATTRLSLLHDSIARTHANRLCKELQRRARIVGPKAKDRFRFITILHCVVEPEIEEVSRLCSNLRAQYKSALSRWNLWSRGVIELELVNLALLQKISQQTDDEARKLNVLSSLTPKEEFGGLLIPGSKSATRVLIHCHAVIDLGHDIEANEIKLRKQLNRFWYDIPYQVRIDKMSVNKALLSSLRDIARYVTKGGNENLRYNAGFGRDLAEDLEAKIWRAGLGRKDAGGEQIEDERGLTVGEVALLNDLCWTLMKQRRSNRGYLLSTSDR